MNVSEVVGLAVTGAGLVAAVYKGKKAVQSDWENRRAREVRIDATLADLVANLAIVKSEVTANGGGSLKDAVNAQRVALGTEIAARRLNEKAAMWEGVVRPDGTTEPTYASPGWIRLTGLTHADTANGGWARCILPADRERVLREGHAANDESRRFEAEYTIRNVLTGVCTPVNHVGMPVFDAQGRLRSWIGMATPLTEERG